MVAEGPDCQLFCAVTEPLQFICIITKARFEGNMPLMMGVIPSNFVSATD